MRSKFTDEDPYLRAAEGEGGAATATAGPPEEEPEETEAKKAEEPKPDWKDRRIASLTFEKRDAERRAADAINAARQRPAPQEDETDPAVIERRIREDERNRALQEAAAMAEAAEFDRECDAIVDRGVKAYPDFKQKMAEYAKLAPSEMARNGQQIAPLGVLERDYKFLTAAMATSNPEKVLIELINNPDELEDVLARARKGLKGYGEMVTAMDRVARRKPKVEISDVAAPPKHIAGGNGGARNPLTDPKAPIKDYVDARQADLIRRAKEGDVKARRLLGAAP